MNINDNDNTENVRIEMIENYKLFLYTQTTFSDRPVL